MALHHNPRIVTDGFHIYVDPADINCYPGSGTSVTDLSTNGRNMSLINGASISDGVFVLDGSNDHVEFSYGGIFDWTAIPWTVSYWANATDFTYPTVIDLIVAGNGHFRFIQNSSFISTTFRTPGGSGTELVGVAATINTGEWYHSTFTRSGTTFKAYLDGVLIGTNTNTNFTNSSGMSAIRIGYSADADGADRTFEGSVGPMAIYERTLTDDEVYQNYEAQKTRFQ